MALNIQQISEGDQQASLEQLRELLCGEALRRLEARIEALEAALASLSRSTAPVGALFRERLDHLHERLVQLRLETARRDEQLHAELLALLAALEDRPADRRDFGQLLIDLGRRLQHLP
ncbi:MAG: hypothetical protein RMK99_03645 [Anaerolineales bacterium]|nr:hypothetical protein [Anaerolineales bacterium]